MTKRTTGIRLLLLLAVLSASCAHPQPGTAPPGVGWHCFPTSPDWMRLESSCHRRRSDCEAALSVHDAAVQDQAPRRCAPAPEAHCFRFWNQMWEDRGPHFVCTRTACECERLKNAGWTDTGIAGTCDHEP
jgi:hypothetical protein